MSKKIDKTHVIAVGNQKGGVGKTATTLHLAAALGELGKKCLVIDLDANCGATKGLGCGTDWLGTMEVLLGEQTPEDVIVTTDPVEGIDLPKNVELLPARRNLEQYENEFRRRLNKFSDPSNALAEPLRLLNGKYDFIFLDTAPNANAPTVAAYRTADWFILSTEPAELSVDGLGDALTDIQAVRDAGNASLRLLGVVMCKVHRNTRVAAAYMEQIKADFAAAGEAGMFTTIITRATAVEDASREKQTLFQFDPGHKVTDQYRDLAREVLMRLETFAKMEAKDAQGGESRGVVNA